MTTPTYTSTTAGQGSLAAAPPRDRRRLRPLFDRVALRTDNASRSRALQIGLDIGALFFVALVFVGTPLPADFVFHCAFVILVLHAFLFGLPGTLLRIGLISIPLVIYADAAALGMEFPPFELAEWPLMFVIALLVAWMAQRRNSTSRRYAALFRQASERLLVVQEAERRRIAGDLHDGVGQVLTAVALTLDAAAAAGRGRVAHEHLAVARGLVDEALASTRELAHRMRPGRLEERGLVAAIRDMAAQSGFPVTVQVEPTADAASRLNASTMVEVYRIVQESLVNAARHSGAASALVTIAGGHSRLTVTITDNGRGFDPAKTVDAGIGLSGMRERARLVDARLAVHSAVESGTRISVSIPIGDAPDDGR
ncbi:MAG: sensor histidine kinase [Candidatus Limnocylindrales bacterium]